MHRYAEHLELKEETDPEQREKLAKRDCRGWFIGEKAERKALEKSLKERHPDVVWEGSDFKELNEVMWDRLVNERMAAAGKTEADLMKDRKGADWKVAIARVIAGNHHSEQSLDRRALEYGASLSGDKPHTRIE